MHPTLKKFMIWFLFLEFVFFSIYFSNKLIISQELIKHQVITPGSVEFVCWPLGVKPGSDIKVQNELYLCMTYKFIQENKPPRVWPWNKKNKGDV